MVNKENEKYQVGLLWSCDKPELPYNREVAISRFKSLELKFKRDPNLKEKYCAAMNDYIEKGHASKLSSEQTQTFSPITNYIPIIQ